MISFSELSHFIRPNQRIWLYQFERSLNEQQIKEIENTLQTFVTDWSSHGQALHAKYTLLEGHYILISVDENIFEASGCSIDKCTHVLQKINTEYSLDLFNRLIIGVYRLGRLNFYTKQVIQKQIAKGEISAEDLFVDLSISTGNALTHMLKPIHQSWFYSSRHA